MAQITCMARNAHGLDVHLGIPVRVVKDHLVSLPKIETKTSGSGGKKKNEFFAALGHEGLDGFITNLTADLAVNARVLVATVQTVIFDDVKHARHLAKYQAAAALGLKFDEQFIEQNHFAGVIYQMLAFNVGRARFLAVEEVGMVAALAELHDYVEEPDRGATSAVDGINVFL